MGRRYIPGTGESEKPDKLIMKAITKALPCTLTEPEILAYGRELGHVYAERERISGEFDAIKSEYKGKIAEQDAMIGKLSARVHSGIETRDVKCEQVMNWTKATVAVTRLDTGEAIESRPMREDEKQMEIQGVAAEVTTASEGTK